ncbi:MAG: (2Fe-2S)-binding protein [Azospirillaceae bacterium]
MPESIPVSLTVNGRRVEATIPARLTIVDFLRDHLGLTGTHVGCAHGVCGACTVRVDGAIIRGCLTLTAQLDGGTIETIEGVADSGEIADLQEAFYARNAMQCGFCTPGMLLTAASLKARGRPVSRQEIRDHISGNLCRCTGYQAIVDAIDTVVNTDGVNADSDGGRR